MGIIETVKMLAEEEARKKSLKEGRKEGRTEGRKEGQEFGREEKARSVVKNLLLMDKFSDNEIAKIAEVTEDFVIKVKAEL